MSKRILITGAGGFIGSFIVEEAIRRGYETWAAVRATTSLEFLTHPDIHFIELDFSNADKLKMQLLEVKNESGKWDYIIHNLGATKCMDFMDFNKINFQYLKTFIEVLKDIDAVPELFFLMSSLSVIGVGDEKDFTPFSGKSIPNPNTKYGLSKLKAELYLQSLPDFPYIIFRPTGVYGPREKDYLIMIKSINRGLDFNAGMHKQLLTFIYVKDLASGIFDALEHGVKSKIYIISDGKAYTQAEFRKLTAQLLNKKFVLTVKCPLFVVYMVSVISEIWGSLRLKPSTLNRDKFKIMKQRNWACDISDARKDFNFSPKYSLKEGLKETIEWYRRNEWI